MSRFKSPPAVCPACGTANPADARFCVRCAARLGAEPSIVAPRLSAPSRPADAGAIPSRPAPLSSGRTDTTAFWVKLGLGGLLLLIGFVCWSVYILTDVKTVPQMPTGQGGGTAGVVLAPVIATPVPAPAPTASTPAAAAEPPLTTIPSTTVPAASTAAAPASGTVVPVPVPAASAASRSRAASRQAARAAEERAAEDRAVVNGGWVEPSRPPAMTSSPSYQDAGPPIVRGPEPRETAPVPVTAPNPVVVQPQPRVETAPDLGPPVIEGPGPRYDFSRPGSGGGR